MPSAVPWATAILPHLAWIQLQNRPLGEELVHFKKLVKQKEAFIIAFILGIHIHLDEIQTLYVITSVPSVEVIWNLRVSLSVSRGGERNLQNEALSSILKSVKNTPGFRDRPRVFKPWSPAGPGQAGHLRPWFSLRSPSMGPGGFPGFPDNDTEDQHGRRQGVPSADVGKGAENAAPQVRGILTLQRANELLSTCVPGSFLIRVSERIKGYVLSYLSKDGCKHFLIDASADSYSFLGADQLQHASLAELVEYHKEEPITSLGKELLLYPCGQREQPPDYQELRQLGRPPDRHRGDGHLCMKPHHPAASRSRSSERTLGDPMATSLLHKCWSLINAKRESPLHCTHPSSKGRRTPISAAPNMKATTLVMYGINEEEIGTF
eukprot:bmy_09576T0